MSIACTQDVTQKKGNGIGAKKKEKKRNQKRTIERHIHQFKKKIPKMARKRIKQEIERIIIRKKWKEKDSEFAQQQFCPKKKGLEDSHPSTS